MNGNPGMISWGNTQDLWPFIHSENGAYEQRGLENIGSAFPKFKPASSLVLHLMSMRDFSSREWYLTGRDQSRPPWFSSFSSSLHPSDPTPFLLPYPGLPSGRFHGHFLRKWPYFN